MLVEVRHYLYDKYEYFAYEFYNMREYGQNSFYQL
jgi:hypothetical protein